MSRTSHRSDGEHVLYHVILRAETTRTISDSETQLEDEPMSDTFIKVSFQEDREGDPLVGHWLDQGMSSVKPTLRRDSAFLGSAKHSSPLVLL
jgi:hypothetical protein